MCDRVDLSSGRDAGFPVVRVFGASEGLITTTIMIIMIIVKIMIIVIIIIIIIIIIARVALCYLRAHHRRHQRNSFAGW